MVEESESTQRPRGVRLPLVLAFVALGLGAWLLLDSLGLPLPPIKRYWPVFMVIAGIATLVDYLSFSRRPGAAGQTVFWLTLAAFSFAFTLGYAGWHNLLDVLPGIPTIFGLALLTTWLASGRRESVYLVPGILFIAIGLAGFLARFEKLRELLPSAQLVWAAILLVGGGFLLWRILPQRQGR